MATNLNPYLNFRGQAKEAMEFYLSVLGGEFGCTTFGEFGISEVPEEQEWYMHSQINTDGGVVLQAADVPSHMHLAAGTNVSVSLHGDDLTEFQLYWDRLAVGATVTAPFEMAPWGDTFGMLTDRFGIQWLLNVVGAKAE